MGFNLTEDSFDEMRKVFKDELHTYRGKHDTTEIEKLPEHRQPQIKYLKILIHALKHMPVKEGERLHAQIKKARILSGTIYILIDEIKASTSSFSIYGSLLGKILENKVLAVAKDDKTEEIDSHNIALITKEAIKFYYKCVFVDGDPEKEFLENNIFSSLEGFKDKDFVTRGNNLAAGKSTLNYVEKRTAREKSDAWFGGLFSSATPSSIPGSRVDLSEPPLKSHVNL